MARYIFRRDKWWSAALVILFIGLSHIFLSLWETHTGNLPGDTSAYVRYARLLARGHVACDDTLSRITQETRDRALQIVGPVWNTSILPDGRTVYTYSPGYPLVLALLYRVGGTWLLLHANFFLLGLSLIALGWLVWEGLGRTNLGLLSGVAAALIVPRLQLWSFDQLTYPWREPLSFLCLLGAAIAAIRFLRKSTYVWLGLTAIMLGFAASVKEANAIYIPCYAVLVFVALKSRRLEHSVRAMALAGLFLLLGLAPLLIQNALTTGNALVSLQTLREIGNYGSAGRVPGLSPGNCRDTVKFYLLLYSSEPWFSWPLLLLAISGLLFAWRFPVGKLLAGILALHVALYVQWPTADFRYMYLVHFPYAFFMAYGGLTLLRAFTGLNKAISRWARPLELIPAVVLAFWPYSPPAVATSGDRFRYSDAKRIAQGIEDHTATGAIVLMNRSLRDALSGYTDIPLIRLKEMARIRADRDIQGAIVDVIQRGTPLYFVDNFDTDPRNFGVVNWSGSDQQSLLWQHDLMPVHRWHTTEFRLFDHAARPNLYLYAIETWRKQDFKISCPVPTNGAAFLFANSRALGSDLVLELNGRTATTTRCAGYYVPVSDLDLQGNVEVICKSATQAPVPRMRDTRFISWDEPISIPIGSDSFPADAPYLPDMPTPQPNTSHRELGSNFRLKLPGRQGPDFFSAVRLSMHSYAASSSIEVSGVGPCAVAPDGSTFFPLASQGVTGRQAAEWAGVISSAPGSQLRLSQIDLYTCLRTLRFEPPATAIGMSIVGFLVPDRPGPGPHSCQVNVNGAPTVIGECLENPFSRLFAIDVPVPPGARECVLSFDGAGIARPKIEAF